MKDSDDYWSKATQDRWFFGALLASTVALVWLFWPYVYVLMFAAVTVVVCWPVYQRLLKWTGNRPFLASGLTTLLLGLLVFVPLAFVLYLFALEVRDVAAWAIDMVQTGEFEKQLDNVLHGVQIPPWLEGMLPELPELPDLPNLTEGLETAEAPVDSDTDTDVPIDLSEVAGEAAREAVRSSGLPGADALGEATRDEVVRALNEAAAEDAASSAGTEEAGREAPDFGRSGESFEQIMARLSTVEGELFQGAQDAALGALTFAGETVPGVIQTAVDLSIDSVIYVFAVITLFTQGERSLEVIKRLSPMDDRYEERLFGVFGEFSRNLVVGSLATAGIQGVIAGIGYGICGLDNVIFLAILTGLGSFVPVVGTVVVWVPVVIYLAVTGDYGYAIFLGIWSLGVVGTVDNVLKPLFMRGSTDIHPLLVFLAVFGGMYWMGLSGLLVGPVIVAFFLALYTIYARDYLGIDEDALEVEEKEGWMSRLWKRVAAKVGLKKEAEQVVDAITPEVGPSPVGGDADGQGDGDEEAADHVDEDTDEVPREPSAE